MEDGTTLLFDLPGFWVVECYLDEHGQRHAVVMACWRDVGRTVQQSVGKAGT